MTKLTRNQKRMLSLLCEEPEIFAWKSRSNGKIVDCFGPPENWTVMQAKKIKRDATGETIGYKTVSITADEHFAMLNAGLTASCAITEAGRAALRERE